MNIFPQKVFDTEIPFYLTKQNKYGCYWTPAHNIPNPTGTMECLYVSRRCYVPKVHRPDLYLCDETTSRVPISDWHDTNTGKMMNFKARSVVGGYYMKLLMEKVKEQK
ncbi:glutaminase domain-containing protein [Bacteroides thetaiotaomicron]|uniref:glutaminase domain-containing protein n=1 Tax=Bacteroides thetaiotaomicron TaxID=818 RepID=UPI001F5B7805|nr:DUF1793 domain-containing protein [Bacteroides thetaiotaomicron]